MATQQVSDDNKKIAQFIDSVFGGDWGISEYSDNDETTWINVLSSPDRPDRGLISFCTIGLSDFLQRPVTHPPLGMEITAVSPRREFEDILAGASFYALKYQWTVEPGTVILGVVDEHITDTTAPHLLFVEPFLWDDQLSTQSLAGKTVDWVLGVPITGREMEYLRHTGFSALEDRFEEAQPDLFDLRRASVI